MYGTRVLNDTYRMPLLELPYEILLHILDGLAKDKGSLCHTALVSRRLGCLVRTVLPRHITIDVPGLRRDGRERCGRYLRACHERPEVAGHTRCASIVWQPDRGHKVSNEYAELNDLLGMLGSLRRLDIDLGCCTDYSPHLLSKAPFLNLRCLKIHLPRLVVADVLHFLNLPNIHHLDVDDIRAFTRSIDAIASEISLHTSAVRHLDLGWYPISPEAMKLILSKTPSLSSLFCVAPGESLVNFEKRKQNEMLGTFSPQSLAAILRPVQETLVRLDLEVSHMWWDHQDKSRLDLSRFQALEIIHVASILFFQSEDPHENRSGVWRLLPKTITELAVSFLLNIDSKPG